MNALEIYRNECPDELVKAQDKIADLETENERYRDALGYYSQGLTSGSWFTPDVAQKALKGE